jgi:CheY-like chemotaxis protein
MGMSELQPHVLVVDDDDMLRKLIGRTLELEGYRVSLASGAAEALALVAGAVPDLVVSDIMMPDVSGYQLLEQLRTDPRCAVVPVIFLSALGDATSVERGQRLGVDHYLVKPFTPQQLLATVSGTLRRYAELRRAHLIAPAPLPPDATPPDCEPTGIAPLDQQVGGLSRGRVYLVSGDFGPAKNLVALQWLHGALTRGEPAVLVTAERLDRILYVGTSAGLALREAVRDGRLQVFGLAERFEQLLETREDVAALAAEIAGIVRETGATRLAVGSVLTMLCSTPRLQASGPVLAELVGGLEAAGVTSLLVADDAVTQQEELTEAYLRRAVFGTLLVEKDGNGTARGILRLERMTGVTRALEPAPFRVLHGTGLVSADPNVEPDVYDHLARLRDRAAAALAQADGEATGLLPRRGGGWRLRDPIALYLRDGLRVALQATTQCAVVVVRFALEGGDGKRLPLTPADLDGLLSSQELLCWAHATDLGILAMGADRAHAASLQDRIAARLADVARMRGARLTPVDGVAVTCPDDGDAVDPLVAALEERLAALDARGRAAVA